MRDWEIGRLEDYGAARHNHSSAAQFTTTVKRNTMWNEGFLDL